MWRWSTELLFLAENKMVFKIINIFHPVLKIMVTDNKWDEVKIHQGKNKGLKNCSIGTGGNDQ